MVYFASTFLSLTNDVAASNLVLKTTPAIPFTPTDLANTTNRVYIGGKEVEGPAPYLVPSNATDVVVVYETEDGYYFADGSTVKTNQVDTTANPATVAGGDLPGAPNPPLDYLAPVYVDGIVTNGIDHWVTNTVRAYTIVESSSSAVTWGATGVTNWYVVTNGTFQINGVVTCKGDVHLVLCNGAKLSANAGIRTDASGSFTVYGTPDGGGELSATGGDSAAGIGGGYGVAATNITINGGTVTATGGDSAAGIGGGNEGAGSHITINGGTVTAMGGVAAAGIGGGYMGAGADITLNGGKVTAKGVQKGAGIGGGWVGVGSAITINGGTVTATGISGGAGIGGGYQGAGSGITINAGTVWVANSGSSELIGSGKKGSAASGVTIAATAKVMFVLIDGGALTVGQTLPEFGDFAILTPETPVDRVLVSGAQGLSALPAFALTNAVTGATSSIEVNGGMVYFASTFLSLTNDVAASNLVLKTTPASVIAEPDDVAHTKAKTVYTNGTEVVSFDDLVVVTNGTPVYVVYETEDGYYFADGSTVRTNVLDTTQSPAAVVGDLPDAPNPTLDYVEPVYVGGTAANGIDHWVTNTVRGYTVVTSATARVTWGAAGATRWYVVENGTFQIDGGVVCTGDVHLVLCDGAKLTVTNAADSFAGIQTDANGSFAVYGTPDGAGELSAAGGDSGAGIGGGREGAGSAITVNGGTVTATGGYLAAGVGGGYMGAGSALTINDGTVTATSGGQAAGIGGGREGAGSNITINGGTVTATGGWSGAGIGGGLYGAGSNITVNGGTVTATGGNTGAGIGGGCQGTGESISIVSGLVFVATAETSPALYTTDLIGCGGLCTNAASGISVSSDAKVFFNLTGLCEFFSGDCLESIAAMPTSLAGWTILTRGTQSVDRVLVAGCGAQGLSALPAFALTNAVTGATSNLTVNAEKHTDFANVFLRLTDADGKLTLKVEPPDFTITQQPNVTNLFTIAAETDGSDGITNYAWCTRTQQTLDFTAITNCLNRDYSQGYVVDGISITITNGSGVLVWPEGQLPAGGVLHFSGPADLQDVAAFYGVDYGELKGEGGNWTYVFTPDEDSLYNLYLGLLGTADTFAISNLTYEVTEYATVAEGKTLTAFPAEKGEVGSNYFCRVTYGHHGTYYTADSDAFEFHYPIVAEPTPIDHATLAVYTNGVLSAETTPDSGLWNVWSNETATVVYTVTDDDYLFTDGTREVTLTLDTTKNPATVVGDLPAAPVQVWFNEQTNRYDTSYTTNAQGIATYVVTHPDQVLPIAYSTNNWGSATNASGTVVGVQVSLFYQGPTYGPTNFISASVTNGLYVWTPAEGDFGNHNFGAMSVSADGTVTNWLDGTVLYTTNFNLTVERPSGGTIAAYTNAIDAAASVGTNGWPLALVDEVKLVATPSDWTWQVEWVKTNGVYATDPSAVWAGGESVTNVFTMPLTNVAVTGSFAVSGVYRDAASNQIEQAYVSATNLIGDLERLTDEERLVYLAVAEYARTNAWSTIGDPSSRNPDTIGGARDDATNALAQVEESARARSDEKPWVIRVGSPFTEDGTNYFDRIDTALKALDYLPYATNIIVYGEQRATVAMREMSFNWTLTVWNWNAAGQVDETKSPFQQSRLVFEETAQVGSLTNRLAAVEGEGRILIANDGSKPAADKTAEAFAQALRDRVAGEPAAATVQVLATAHDIAMEGTAYECLEGEYVAIDSLTIADLHAITNWVALSAPAVTNRTELTWDLTGDNHATCLANYDDVVTNGATLIIRLDADQTEGDIIADYEIARRAATASGATFKLMNEKGEVGEVTVDGGVRFVGAKAYTLDRVSADDGTESLVLSVSWGMFAVTYDAMGPYYDDQTVARTIDTYVNAGYALPDPAPARADYEFLGWYDGWTNGAAQVTNGMALFHLADHTLYAKWLSKAIDPSDPSRQPVWEDVLKTGSYRGGVIIDGPKDPESQPVPSDFIIPERLGDPTNGTPVFAINQWAFYHNAYDAKVEPARQIRSVSIPTYLNEIGQYAFYNCAALTNLLLSETRSYADGKATKLLIGAHAFDGSDLRTLVFPPNTVTDLGSGCFANCTNLTAIYFYGDVTSATKGPFRFSGNPSAPVKIYLSPTMAADATLVQKLTNAMNSASIELVTEPLGTIEWKTFDCSSDPIKVRFSATIESPWGAITEKSVRLFYTTDLSEFDGIGHAISPEPGTFEKDGDEYKVEFAKPEEAGADSLYFRLTVGAEE